MAGLFTQILNMSLTGSVVICAVLLARACMRRLPKIFSYALWSVVLFRLLCPVAFTAPISILDMVETEQRETSNNTSIVTYIPATVDTEADFIAVQPVQTETGGESEEKLHMTPMHAAALVWVSGTVGMILYSVIQFLRLWSRLVGALQLKRNIYLADHIDTAFVVGLLQPRIYLPSAVPSKERYYILAHEQHHIRRGDHIIKLLGFLALCIHWFNPLVWVAFVLAGKDMEMSCDEAVIRRFGSEIRAEYSASLLRLAAQRKPIPGMPLAFGEGDTKGRIMNMAKWKRTKPWVSILCGVVCLAILAACALNPRNEVSAGQSTSDPAVSGPGETIPAAQENTINILLTVLPEGEDSAKLGDSVLVLSLERENDSLTIRSIPGDQVVSLPDYENHTTGNEPFRICYALGYAWGGRTAAMEMTNACLQDAFRIHVDYNAEMTWGEVKALVDSLGGIRVPIAEDELFDISGLENPVLNKVQPGILHMDAETAAVYGAPQADPASMEGARLRQRKLFAGIFSSIRENHRLAEVLPPLYDAYDLDGAPGEWSAVLEYLNEHTGFYLTGGESQIPAEVPDATGVEIVTDQELVQYGALKVMLPEGCTGYSRDGFVTLVKEGVEVGSIRCYNAPDVPFGYTIEYLRALGLPEAQETEEPIAYMIGSNIGGGIDAEFFHELKPETLNVKHNIYIVGDLVYDICYDRNLLSDIQADKFLRSAVLDGEPLQPEQPEMEESLILCRNVVDLIRSGAYQVVSERKNQGKDYLNGSSQTVYTALREDWISISHVPDDDSYHGYMYAAGQAYSNEGTGWEDDGSVHWAADPYPDAVYIPWIASFWWDEKLVTYIDTVIQDGRKTVMLRIDQPFQGYEEISECYFVDMNFTEDGSFLNADIDIVFAQGSQVIYVELQEAIVTLDENTVRDYIQKEYTRAVNES